MIVFLLALTAAIVLGLGARPAHPKPRDTGRHAGQPRHNPTKHTAAHAKPVEQASHHKAVEHPKAGWHHKYVSKHDGKAAIA